MAIYIFPLLLRKPGTFDKDTVARSLIPDEKYGVSFGYEYSDETHFNISVTLNNIDPNDYLLLTSFYDDVSTILPFIFSFEDKNYNVRFKDPIVIKQEIYIYKNVTMTLETYTGDMNVI